jgi:hypothetical protein
MSTQYIHIWDRNVDVGVSQCPAEIRRIVQYNGSMATQRIDDEVWEVIWVIALSMGIIDKEGAGPKKWVLLSDSWVT